MKRAVLVTPALVLTMSLALPAQPMAAGKPAATASTTSTSGWCGSLAVPPCIESATRNGVAVPETDPTWEVSLTEVPGTAAQQFLWSVLKRDADDPFDLGPEELSASWVIEFNTGPVVPRVAFSRAQDHAVTRSGLSPHWIQIAGRPAPISDHPVPLGDPNQCDVSTPVWTCPPQATADRVVLGGSVSDYGQWSDPVEREALYGMDWATNIDQVASPPSLREDAAGVPFLEFQVANSHLRTDGGVFEGFKHVRIPSAFLQAAYGIDDPTSLTTGGVTVLGTGGAAISSVSIVGGSVVVVIEGMTFSQRLVRLKRGTITPTKPTNLRAKRTSPKRGRIRFAPAKERGSRITGYQARCVRASSVVKASAKASPVVVKGLRAGVRYQCRVRARSKAGPGVWSKGVRMPARP